MDGEFYLDDWRLSELQLGQVPSPVISGFAWEGCNTIICGPPKAGKSTLAANAMARLAGGYSDDIFTVPSPRISVIICKEKPSILIRTINRTAVQLGISRDKIIRHCVILSAYKSPEVSPTSPGFVKTMTDKFHRYQEQRGVSVGLLYLDTAQRFLPPNTSASDDGPVRSVIEPLNELASHHSFATVLTHHTIKSRDKGYLGSQAWRALSDFFAILDVGQGDWRTLIDTEESHEVGFRPFTYRGVKSGDGRLLVDFKLDPDQRPAADDGDKPQKRGRKPKPKRITLGDQMLEAIEKHPEGIPYKELFPDRRPSTRSEAKTKLIEQGKVKEDGGKLYPVRSSEFGAI